MTVMAHLLGTRVAGRTGPWPAPSYNRGRRTARPGPGPCGEGAEMRFVEERDFAVRLDLRCTFADGYEGELDGYAWLREFQDRIVPRGVEAAVRTHRAIPGRTIR